jgi:hypothetical protein
MGRFFLALIAVAFAALIAAFVFGLRAVSWLACTASFISRNGPAQG